VAAVRKSFAGTAVITGGTGRFTNAAGRLDLAGTLTFDHDGIGHAFSTYTGQIVYDASNRRE